MVSCENISKSRFPGSKSWWDQVKRSKPCLQVIHSSSAFYIHCHSVAQYRNKHRGQLENRENKKLHKKRNTKKIWSFILEVLSDFILKRSCFLRVHVCTCMYICVCVWGCLIRSSGSLYSYVRTKWEWSYHLNMLTAVFLWPLFPSALQVKQYWVICLWVENFEGKHWGISGLKALISDPRFLLIMLFSVA